MKKETSAGRSLAALAAICWSLFFPLFFNQTSGHTPPVVFTFHFLFWGAIFSMALLTLAGRIEELSLINRKSGALFLLVLSGGFGLWALTSAAFHLHPDSGRTFELVFYSGPIFLVFFSLFTKEGSGIGRLWMAVLGFFGVFLILHNIGGLAFSSPVHLAISATVALLWAVFSISSCSLLGKADTLPGLALILSISAVCLLVTCLSMGTDVLGINRDDIWVSMAIGAVPIAGGFGFWMKCMHLQNSPANTAAWWYGALICGVLWYHYLADATLGWPALAGIIVILLSLSPGGGKREKTESTFGDLITKNR